LVLGGFSSAFLRSSFSGLVSELVFYKAEVINHRLD